MRDAREINRIVAGPITKPANDCHEMHRLLCNTQATQDSASALQQNVENTALHRSSTCGYGDR
eukprot:scaffold241566_cov17-Prasinocladus_malaysianus.AAC.1